LIRVNIILSNCVRIIGGPRLVIKYELGNLPDADVSEAPALTAIVRALLYAGAPDATLKIAGTDQAPLCFRPATFRDEAEFSKRTSLGRSYRTVFLKQIDLSRKTRQNIKAVFHRMVELAMLWGLMPAIPKHFLESIRYKTASRTALQLAPLFSGPFSILLNVLLHWATYPPSTVAWLTA
jgi:hypothetical protein